MTPKERILARYGHKDGKVYHHGDCHIYGVGVCTCGLLHDLEWDTTTHELFEHYGRDMTRHEKAIGKLTDFS